ncbi:MAG: hypothetical protein GVY13_06130 [Alphaproteobacteria bacterium]|jgi:hypothetical protein|nr:hypothetical protein [Alphaproteobacteria bacterium]
MARIHCRAIVMGPVSGSDSTYEFDAPDDVFVRPADEAVEAFMAHLHEAGVISSAVSYELNSAVKNREKNVITAIGNLILNGDELPFVAMISRT